MGVRPLLCMVKLRHWQRQSSAICRFSRVRVDDPGQLPYRVLVYEQGSGRIQKFWEFYIWRSYWLSTLYCYSNYSDSHLSVGIHVNSAPVPASNDELNNERDDECS